MERISRRTLLLSAMGLSFYLSGCGGGGGETTPLASAERTVPTGDLQNQINQFSEAIDVLSTTYKGTSPALDEANTFLGDNGARSRGRAAGSDKELLFLATWHGLNLAAAGYERIINSTLALDNAGFLGSQVTTGNNLSASASVNNPQWTAAMLERNYHTITILGIQQKLLQISGISGLINLVNSQTEPDKKLITYSILAISFNDWVKALCDTVGVAVAREWLLDVSESVTTSNFSSQIGRISIILPKLPYGIGFRPSVTRNTSKTDDELKVEAGKLFGFSFLGAFTKNFLTDGLLLPGGGVLTTRNFEDVIRNAKANFNYLKLVSKAPLLKASGLVDVVQSVGINLATAALENYLPGNTGGAARCAIQIALGALSTAQLGASAIATSSTIVGPIVFGSLAVVSAYETYKKTMECIDEFQKVITDPWGKAAQGLDAATRPDGQVPSGRDIPALTNPNAAECDQLARASVSKKEVSTPTADGQTAITPETDPGLLRKLLCGVLTGSTRIAGVPARTFTNLEIATLGMIFDLGRRNTNTIQVEKTPNGFRYFSSDFAVLIRREPGTTTANVPAITSAQMMCSSPGFIPMRSDSPKDLTTLLSLLALQSISALGTGVNTNVR